MISIIYDCLCFLDLILMISDCFSRGVSRFAVFPGFWFRVPALRDMINFWYQALRSALRRFSVFPDFSSGFRFSFSASTAYVRVFACLAVSKICIFFKLCSLSRGRRQLSYFLSCQISFVIFFPAGLFGGIKWVLISAISGQPSIRLLHVHTYSPACITFL